MEAISIRLEAIAIRLEALSFTVSMLEAKAIRLEAIAIRLEAIPTIIRLETIAIRLEANRYKGPKKGLCFCTSGGVVLDVWCLSELVFSRAACTKPCNIQLGTGELESPLHAVARCKPLIALGLQFRLEMKKAVENDALDKWMSASAAGQHSAHTQ